MEQVFNLNLFQATEKSIPGARFAHRITLLVDCTLLVVSASVLFADSKQRRIKQCFFCFLFLENKLKKVGV